MDKNLLYIRFCPGLVGCPRKTSFIVHIHDSHKLYRTVHRTQINALFGCLCFQSYYQFTLTYSKEITMTHLQSQLRVLSVNEGENLATTIFRLEKGMTCRFKYIVLWDEFLFWLFCLKRRFFFLWLSVRLIKKDEYFDNLILCGYLFRVL